MLEVALKSGAFKKFESDTAGIKMAELNISDALLFHLAES